MSRRGHGGVVGDRTPGCRGRSGRCSQLRRASAPTSAGLEGEHDEGQQQAGQLATTPSNWGDLSVEAVPRRRRIRRTSRTLSKVRPTTGTTTTTTRRPIGIALTSDGTSTHLTTQRPGHQVQMAAAPGCSKPWAAGGDQAPRFPQESRSHVQSIHRRITRSSLACGSASWLLCRRRGSVRSLPPVSWLVPASGLCTGKGGKRGCRAWRLVV
jgi:hypothetical protein